MATDQSLTNWKALLKKMKLESIRDKSAGFFEMSGGFDMRVRSYRDDTTNELTRSVSDFIKFSGFYCNRISVQGTARKEKIQLAHGRVIEKVRYTPSMTNKGTADLLAIIKGRAVSIEIKCRATKDRQSDDQKKEAQRIEKAGGVYIIVQDFPQFLEWYNGFIDNH